MIRGDVARVDLFSMQRESLICHCSVYSGDGLVILRLSLDGRHLYSRGHQTRDAAIGGADALREDYLSRGWSVIDSRRLGQAH